MTASEYGSLEPVTCSTHGIVGAATAVGEFGAPTAGSVTGDVTSAAVLAAGVAAVVAGADVVEAVDVVDSEAAGFVELDDPEPDDPELDDPEPDVVADCSLTDWAVAVAELPEPTEPLLVWALTVVLSSADVVLVDPVPAPDADDEPDDDATEDDPDPADADSPDAGAEVCVDDADEPADS